VTVDTNVSEKHTVSIFREVCFSETLVSTYESTRRHNPEQHRHKHNIYLTEINHSICSLTKWRPEKFVDVTQRKFKVFCKCLVYRVSRDSSGSIVSDYGLDDRAIEVRSPTGADFSSSPCVQTGSGAPPSLLSNGTGVPFPRGKARPGRHADHSLPSSAEIKNE
jgi:hypothetical protein